MRRILLISIIAVLVVGSVFVLSYSHKVIFSPEIAPPGAAGSVVAKPDSSIPEAPAKVVATPVTPKNTDSPIQQKLANPPEVIKAIYLTGWSAGSASKINQVIDLAKKTGINAVVIDIKDYSGYVSYAMDVPLAKSSGAEKQLRIIYPNELIKKLHDNNIYAIARITAFQDPILAEARPDLAVKNKTTGGVWKDNKGLAWLDPAGKESWDYLVSIADDSLFRGFDEINFDYVRFPSDGALSNMGFPFYDSATEKHEVLRNFFSYLRSHIDGKISADLFGLTTVAQDDMGIGQVIEDAAQYFDYVSPMVYPSHYAAGFIGYKTPANYPYEVISYSLNNAVNKFLKIPVGPDGKAPKLAQIRPWLQGFNLGATYTPSMINDEIKAVTDSLCVTEPTATEAVELAGLTGPSRKCGSGEADIRKSMYGGWMMWDAANLYTNTKAALSSN